MRRVETYGRMSPQCHSLEFVTLPLAARIRTRVGRTAVHTTRAAYWADKFERNMERDARKEAELKSLGWSVLIVWECETVDNDKLADRLAAYLSA